MSMRRLACAARWLIAAAIALNSPLCAATSRMGTAEVTTVGGLPCFSIPYSRDTRHGLPLQVLYVSEVRSPDAGLSLPAELWHIAASDTASPPSLHPQTCIRYGQAPATTVQRTVKPLQMFHPYHVAIRAPHENAGMMAYVAQFCLIQYAGGHVRVQVIAQNGAGDDERFSVCRRPQ